MELGRYLTLDGGLGTELDLKVSLADGVNDIS